MEQVIINNFIGRIALALMISNTTMTESMLQDLLVHNFNIPRNASIYINIIKAHRNHTLTSGRVRSAISKVFVTEEGESSFNQLD
tara:strand:+ start:1709 stop:1963 length:255 start_codon:yes stop_codon:yes gene_type:complete